MTISILGVLLAILLPGLSAARESARRTACLNNLSHIGKAITAYDSSQGHLPGWRMELPGYTEQSGAHVSWTVAILPFLGEHEIFDWYQSFGVGGAADDVRSKRMLRFVCPTVTPEVVTPAPLSYMGNGGTGAELTGAGGRQYRGDGVFHDTVGSSTYSSLKYSMSVISDRDGAGSTMLLTERTGLHAPLNTSWSHAPLPAAANANAVVSSHVVLHPPALENGQRPPQDRRVINATEETTISANPDWRLRYPSSRHGEGACVSFCDGRTHFVSEAIAPWVYCQMLTSDRRTQSPRAADWEVYPVGELWVRYVFDDRDLNPKR